MKKTTLLFGITALISLSLALYNKKRQNPSLVLAAKLLGGTVARLGCSLKKAIALKGIASFLGVTLVSLLCKKAV